MTCKIELFAFSSGTEFTPERIQEIIALFKDSGAVTILDREAVLGQRHLAWGYKNAARAILDGKARARDPGLEVLRWLAGSHQVGEALVRVGPVAGTTEVLVAVAPADWPRPEDRSDHPIFIRPRNAIEIDIDDLTDGSESLDLKDFGSPKAPAKLGIALVEGADEKEVELTVLEWVATTELR